MKAPTDNKINNACCKYDKEDGGAMFVKRRDISLWWGFYNLYDTIGMEDGVMNELRSPSVAILGAVTEDCIACHILAHKDTIMDNERVHCVV